MLDSVLFFFMVLGIFLVAYHLLLYPLGVVFMAQLKRSDSAPASPETTLRVPSISFIIAAYNEEQVIGGKLENTLSLIVPSADFEVILAADGSSDRTADIGARFSERGVKVLHRPERMGKSAALNRAVAQARGEYLVFSDANNMFSPDSLCMLLRPLLERPDVGAVCGAKHIVADDEREATLGDSAYWRYESKIKSAESAIGSTTALDGEIFAMRRNDWVDIDKGVINDDAEITFTLIGKGKKIIYEPGAKSYEKASHSLQDDFNVKVRMIAGGYQTIRRYGERLFSDFTWFNFAFLSHKVLRWTMPFCVLTVVFTTLLTLPNDASVILLVLQFFCLAMALLGFVTGTQTLPGKIAYLFKYFVVMNAAAARGFVASLQSSQSVNWKKAER